MDPTKIIDKAVDAFDDNVYSEQESQGERTERLRIDMQSTSIMPKIIRPVVTLIVTLVWSFVMVFSFWRTTSLEVVAAVTATLNICVGFYFHSKRQEKIAEKKTNAAIKIEALKTRHELREEKRDKRAERRKD